MKPDRCQNLRNPSNLQLPSVYYLFVLILIRAALYLEDIPPKTVSESFVIPNCMLRAVDGKAGRKESLPTDFMLQPIDGTRGAKGVGNEV